MCSCVPIKQLTKNLVVGQIGPMRHHGLLIPTIMNKVFVILYTDFIYGHSFLLSVMDLKLGGKDRETSW